MRSKLTTLLTVIGAVTVLVLAANTVAMATTGKAILAGKINKSTKMTAITRTTPGTGLQVKTRSTANAPFAVNGKGRVVNLNADTVDGKDSSLLGTRVYTWTYAGAGSLGQDFVLSGLPVGTYLMAYDVPMSSPTFANGSDATCYLQSTASSYDVIAGRDVTTKSAGYGLALSSSSLVTQKPGGKVKLHCNVISAGTWIAFPDQPVRITAVPVSTLVNKGTPAPARTR